MLAEIEDCYKDSMRWKETYKVKRQVLHKGYRRPMIYVTYGDMAEMRMRIITWICDHGRTDKIRNASEGHTN